MSRRRDSAAPGHVRIIGGRWRGTRLPVTDAPGLRPSSGRVRETLFNWLQPTLPGARVLDLFAGSGALGLESVSRGAREALLVERDPGLAQSLRQTSERLHAGETVHIVQADALQWLRAPLHGRFDLVFLDPPFDSGLWREALALLPPWLADAAWLYLESPIDADAAPGAAWSLHREGRTREARYALYRRAVPAAATLVADSNAHGAATE
ncbi:MAG TPA: 16S rRNA (guanine(966)-N(2))-methyltransferase RsmD [Luteimonas sp.]|nr:16S rRNA (guanine(966)-N(2))-methyltransferase RsmD [Luteimonas sp.]